MRADHLVILVEELSMEAFLRELLPRLLGDRATFEIFAHQGKNDLLRKLDARLRGYAHWLPEASRIVVIVDCDNDDCEVLKRQLEEATRNANLTSRSTAGPNNWQVVNRIAIEELEAWYFGEWRGVQKAYPKLKKNIPRKASYRIPDTITNGTWETLERIFQRAGYFSGGLRKIEVACAVGREIDPALNRSASFVTFRDAVLEAII